MTSSDIEKIKQPSHAYKGIRFQAIPVSPSDTNTPLQIVCFFDYSKNQTYGGGTEAVDKHFEGAIRALRADGHFRGDLLETLLLTPNKNQIPAQKLLMVGLGDPAQFNVDHMKAVGRVAMNEAIKLNVESFCFAPSIKDAGVSTVPAGDVTVSLASGMFAALDSAQYLAEKGLIPALKLKEAIFLAGPQHIENSQAGLNKAIESMRVSSV